MSTSRAAGWWVSDFVELLAECARPWKERRLWASGILLEWVSSSTRWGRMEGWARSARAGRLDLALRSAGFSVEFLRKKEVTRCGMLALCEEGRVLGAAPFLPLFLQRRAMSMTMRGCADGCRTAVPGLGCRKAAEAMDAPEQSPSSACLAAHEGRMKMKIREGEREELADDGGGSQRGELGQVASRALRVLVLARAARTTPSNPAVAARTCAMRGRLSFSLFLSLYLSVIMGRWAWTGAPRGPECPECRHPLLLVSANASPAAEMNFPFFLPPGWYYV